MTRRNAEEYKNLTDTEMTNIGSFTSYAAKAARLLFLKPSFTNPGRNATNATSFVISYKMSKTSGIDPLTDHLSDVLRSSTSDIRPDFDALLSSNMKRYTKSGG